MKFTIKIYLELNTAKLPLSVANERGLELETIYRSNEGNLSIFIYRFRTYRQEGTITLYPHATAISQIADFTSADGMTLKLQVVIYIKIPSSAHEFVLTWLLLSTLESRITKALTTLL